MRNCFDHEETSEMVLDSSSPEQASVAASVPFISLKMESFVPHIGQRNEENDETLVEMEDEETPAIFEEDPEEEAGCDCPCASSSA